MRLLPGNPAEEHHCAEVVERTVVELGGRHVLVNNVAYQRPAQRWEDIDPKQWEHTFAVNVGSYFHVTRAALAHLRAGAAIINTASVNGLRGNRDLIDYSATKGAVLAFTMSLAQSLLDRGIRGQLRRAGAGVDAADPGHVRRREGRRVRRAGTDGAGGAAGTRSPRRTCSSPASGCPRTTPARCWRRSAARPTPADAAPGRPRATPTGRSDRARRRSAGPARPVR
ncbi:hypothetical protein GCM10010123_31980 [Pilimelia anulata]|uniref:Uncharacterized protein n=1 Tax=Pilimelia anulata TaxID=53371 RepID=A0A8J3BDQ5_9ACTN|nr:SDR family NAD(P)-dependent oxidoreductase [Pilimelia anulata]GGJ99620.1 hypothetical protein GCM10010123_31980 [Pilimelia anulata]